MIITSSQHWSNERRQPLKCRPRIRIWLLFMKITSADVLMHVVTRNRKGPFCQRRFIRISYQWTKLQINFQWFLSNKWMAFLSLAFMMVSGLENKKHQHCFFTNSYKISTPFDIHRDINAEELQPPLKLGQGWVIAFTVLYECIYLLMT